MKQEHVSKVIGILKEILGGKFNSNVERQVREKLLELDLSENVIVENQVEEELE